MKQSWYKNDQNHIPGPWERLRHPGYSVCKLLALPAVPEFGFSALTQKLDIVPQYYQVTGSWGGRDKRIPEDCWPTSLPKIGGSGFSKKWPCLRYRVNKNKGRHLMLACGLLTYMRNACLHICTHTHTQMRDGGGGQVEKYTKGRVSFIF